MPDTSFLVAILANRRKRISIEAGATAVISFIISLIVFGPLLGRLDVGWSGGDMLSTYVNSVNWNGFSYGVSNHFGFPLGMNLNYFPGIDITENSFAAAVNAVTGSTFLGINLLIVLSFPLVAVLAYLTIRMTRLQGPLAIALAVSFTFIPFHWGRALGHTYLSTLYSAVIGLGLALLIGSGQFERFSHRGVRRQRILFILVISLMVVVIAWSGVYYVAFTLILGAAALLWRIAHRVHLKQFLLEVIPYAGVGLMAAIGFIPALATLRGDPPLASLGDRMASESVTYAGNLSMAILPLPQSSFPRMGYYNQAVLDAYHDAPYGESNVITNFGTWVTAASLLVIVIALILRTRRPQLVAPTVGTPVTLAYVGYLMAVTVLFFIPWGVNFLFADLVSAQIRGWNRLLPILLLLFILGAAAALVGTRFAERLAIAVPIGLVILGLTAADSVYPFRQAYVTSVSEAGEVTDAAREYSVSVNAAIPENCGVLQLPYMAYPEFGVVRGINDYDHFWTSITNPGKKWSYGSVKFTDASIWASQLPLLPTKAQLAELHQSGFCAIHLDTRGFLSEELPAVEQYLTEQAGEPVATGFDGAWLLYSLGKTTSDSTGTPLLHPAFIEPDLVTVTERASVADHDWWWTRKNTGMFTLTPSSVDSPLSTVTGGIGAPDCGVRPVTVTLTAGDQVETTAVIARPGEPTPFALTLPNPTTAPATLSVDAMGAGCPAGEGEHFAQVFDIEALPAINP